MANRIQRLGEGTNLHPPLVISWALLPLHGTVRQTSVSYLVLALNYVFAWNKILATKPSVSARLNYLWILGNTRCLRENLRKFV